MLTRKQVEDAAWEIMGDDEDRYFGGSMAEAADRVISLVYKIMTDSPIGPCEDGGQHQPVYDLTVNAQVCEVCDEELDGS